MFNGALLVLKIQKSFLPLPKPLCVALMLITSTKYLKQYVFPINNAIESCFSKHSIKCFFSFIGAYVAGITKIE